MPFDRSKSLGPVVNLLARLITRELAARTGALGVRPGQFPVIAFIWAMKETTQAELCELMEIEQPTLANTLNRMERDGLISRRPDPEDARRSFIRLSDKARAISRKVIAKGEMVQVEAMAGLSNREQEAFLRTCSHMIQNLRRRRVQRQESEQS